MRSKNTNPNTKTKGNHNGLVTHHQLQSIFPVNLRVKNTINITVSIPELTKDTVGVVVVSLLTDDVFHLPISL